MRPDVPSDAVAPYVGTGEVLEHPDDGLALLIGDGVERLVRLLDRPNGLNHRVSRIQRIEAHCRLARSDAIDLGLPFGMEMLRRLVLHPAREALVEPEVVPPGHGDEVTEPLVRHFVRLGAVDALALA